MSSPQVAAPSQPGHRRATVSSRTIGVAAGFITTRLYGRSPNVSGLTPSSPAPRAVQMSWPSGIGGRRLPACRTVVTGRVPVPMSTAFTRLYGTPAR
ncbi:hypothetical protein [Actinoplanes couchii]|uniref:hypothetical protein n=1 Tax=Actinoplanes couchii TaxID=403638 RepID=UPI002865A257|nr:hypothetical protein [Actinoplanes couchii]MDR6323241.1 hypothetical protein [Actinoplanes couchii]